MKQLEELALQALEQEKTGISVYTAAVTCAVNKALKYEWLKRIEQTKLHVAVLNEMCGTLRIDVKKETAGRDVVRGRSRSLVEAMRKGKEAGDPAAAELIACECVVIAATKHHLGWALLGKCVEHVGEARASLLKRACDEIEQQESEHLCHAKGWCRELWTQSLGIKAVLPPPEERRTVRTPPGAARTERTAADENHRPA